MNHLTLAQIHPDNYRYYVEEPDHNFSAERNYQVINQVIEENDKMQAKLSDAVTRNAANIADILASFAKYKLDIGGGKQLDEWLGRGWQARVYSDKLVEKIRMAEAILPYMRQRNLQNGNTLYGGNFIT